METVICEKTQVIWYELNSDADCYSIFKNINHGKIPLTDAELVKAMLLNSKYYAVGANANEKIVKQEQDRYARLWDEIQKALSNEKMWSFVTGGGNIDIPTNIDFLIRLIVQKDILKEEKDVLKEKLEELDNSDYKYFSYFENRLAKETDKKKYVESVFEQLKNTFRTIQDWYNNYELHNYIGFILTYSAKRDVSNRIPVIIDLISDYESMSKSQFIKDALKQNRIKGFFVKLNINDINYEDNQKDVEKLLIIFNIEELNKLHEKFNFAVDEQGWSIEHIKAQHSEITEKDKRKEYLKTEKESLEELKKGTVDTELVKKIDNIIPQIDSLIKSTQIDEEDFKRVAELIDRDIDNFSSDDMHRIGNLALLSKKDNSSLGKKPFYRKRQVVNTWLTGIEENEKNKKNIPHSTQKVFLKMYSQQEYALDFTRWRKKDFDDMFKRQKKMLSEYIQGC